MAWPNPSKPQPALRPAPISEPAGSTPNHPCPMPVGGSASLPSCQAFRAEWPASQTCHNLCHEPTFSLLRPCRPSQPLGPDPSRRGCRAARHPDCSRGPGATPRPQSQLGRLAGPTLKGPACLWAAPRRWGERGAWHHLSAAGPWRPSQRLGRPICRRRQQVGGVEVGAAQQGKRGASIAAADPQLVIQHGDVEPGGEGLAHR